MIEGNYGMGFLLEPLEPLRMPGKAHGEEFERGLTARDHVGGQIDFAHPAAADPFGNFVVTERLTHEQVSLLIFNNPRRKPGS